MTLEGSLDSDADRERIMLTGQPGTGKTYALLALCDYIQLRDPEAKVFILDADRGMGKVKRRDWPQVNNITLHKLVRRWDQVEEFMEKVGPQQTERDWILIDMLGRFWEMAQALEVSAVHGVSPGQAMLEARKKMVEAQKLQAPGTLPQPDWGIIKRFHNDSFIDEISAGWDCNLVVSTGIQKLDIERDDSLLVEIFAPFGFRPEGEKYNVHRFDTIMMMGVEGDKRNYSTAKDRGRPLMHRVGYSGSIWETYEEKLAKEELSFAPRLHV